MSDGRAFSDLPYLPPWEYNKMLAHELHVPCQRLNLAIEQSGDKPFYAIHKYTEVSMPDPASCLFDPDRPSTAYIFTPYR